MKLEYQEQLTNKIDFNDGGLEVKLIKNETALPGKLDHCAFFQYIEETNINIIGINKNKSGDSDEIKKMFTEEFLGIVAYDDATSKTRRIKNMFENWKNKNLRDDIEKALIFSDKIEDVLINDGKFDITEIAKELFENENMRNDLLEHAERRKLSDQIVIDKVWIENKFKSKQIKTNTSVVIKADFDIFNDTTKMEIKHNGDGTIDYIIKGIRNITQ